MNHLVLLVDEASVQLPPQRYLFHDFRDRLLLLLGLSGLILVVIVLHLLLLLQ